MAIVVNLPLDRPAFDLRGGLLDHSTESGHLDGPAKAGSRFDLWRKRIRFRRHLARLRSIDPGLIEDIGLALHEADSELAKAFWRL